MTDNHNFPDIWGALPEGTAPIQMSPRPQTVEVDQDMISKFLVDFKAGAEPQTTQWIRLASLVASHSFSCDIVIRALGPKEEIADGATSLDKLGVAIARKTGAKYCPSRLQRSSNGIDGIMRDPGAAATEQYRFDKSFLPPKTRVLVVGDPETIPSTFEAIKTGILEALPEAEVKFFTLSWLGEHVKGGHLDAKYFLSHASPVSVLQKGGTEEMAQPTPSREAKSRKGKSAPEKPAAQGKEKARVVPAPVSQPGANVAKPEGHLPGNMRNRLFVLGGAVLIIGLGLMVIISRTWTNGQRWLGSGTQDIIPVQTVQPEYTKPVVAKEAPVEIPKPPAPQKKSDGPGGVITVPKAGLRSAPSLTAKPVKATVKNNERVTILKRAPSSSGPDWVQIETESGKVGWVWANVVREQRRR